MDAIEITAFRSSTMKTVIALAVAATLAAVFYSDRISALGADISWHYALTRIVMNGGDTVAALAVLNAVSYPMLPHSIAALLGWLSNSPILGLMITCVVAVAITYTAIFLLLARAGAVTAAVAGVTLVLVGFFNIHQRGLFGFELVDNFFVGQMVAEAIFWVWLLAILSLRRFRDGWHVDMLTLLAFHLATSSHLVPAMRIPAVYGLLLLFGSLRNPRQFIRLTVFGLCIIAVLMLDPAITKMRSNAQHNGYLEFAFALTPSTQAALIGLLIAISIPLLIISTRRHNTAAELLALTGYSIAALALLQFLALQAGFGSDYAVRKHFFGIFTMIPIELIVLGVLTFIEDTTVSTNVSATAAAVFGIVMTAAVTPEAKISTERMAAFAKFSREFVQHHTGNGITRPVAMAKSIPPTINAAITVGEFDQPLTHNTLDVLNGVWPSRATEISFAIVDQIDDRFPEKCNVAAPSSQDWRAVDMSCVVNSMETTKGTTYSFTRFGTGERLLGSGWSGGEDNGTWSIAERPIVNLPRLSSGENNIVLELSPYISDRHRRITVTVVGAGTVLGKRIYQVGEDLPRLWELHLPDHLDRVEFIIDKPASPSELGISADPRTLGFKLHSMAIR